ncbi:ferredoxin [Butyricicoccus sp. 1XD8-22]|nr:ferredoxin [Butyricicoccus sp. 1XD8-22]
MTVHGMFFSGTGTTERVVRAAAGRIAERLGCGAEVFDFTPPDARQEPKCFQKDDLVVLGVPVIAGRVPNLLLKYLGAVQGSGALGVPVVLFGNRSYDDALIELRDIMESGGFRTIAGGAFAGEHSFSTTLGRGRPDAEDLAQVQEFADRIAEKVQAGALASPVAVRGESPVRAYYTPRDRNGNGIDIRKVKPKTSDACIKCGWCAVVCPLGSIDGSDPSVVSGICMKCCKCVKGCPQGAKYFDDAGYLYHKEELEAMYGGCRAENEIFV